jgi:DNA-binding transcriptional LysR family regulator
VELRTLRYFVAIADSGGVTAAAAAVHVAQPALSRQLKGLERELGTALFDRGNGRLTLTAAGTAFLPLARELLSRVEEVSVQAQALASGRLAQLRIAAPSTTITDVVAPFIAQFRPTDPMPSVTAVPTAEVYRELDRGAADLVLSPATPPHHLASRPIADFPIWLQIRADGSRRPPRSVDIADLDPARLLLLPRPFVQRELLEEAAARAGLPLETAREVTSPEVAQALAAAGWGDAVVSDESRFGLHGVHILIDRAPLTMPIYAAWKRRHFAADQVSEFADRLVGFCADHFSLPATVGRRPRAAAGTGRRNPEREHRSRPARAR